MGFPLDHCINMNGPPSCRSPVIIIMCFHPPFFYSCLPALARLVLCCTIVVTVRILLSFLSLFPQDLLFSHGLCRFLYNFGNYYLSIIIKMLTWGAFSIFTSPFCFFLFFSKIKYFLIFRHMVLIYSFCFMSQTIVPRCFPAGLVHVIRKCPLCISKHF